MKIKPVSFFLVACAVVASQGAFAVDGNIYITGSFTSTTCTINGNGSGGNNFTVALPTVSASTLATAGATAGRTAFNIALTNCTGSSGTVHTFFQPTQIDTTTGNLTLNSGGASNVEIQLQNSDFSTIALSQADGSQNSKAVAINSGAATLHYYAQYYATGQAIAGAANTSVLYTMTYQ